MDDNTEEACSRILDAGGLEIHDVDDGEPPFDYSSANRGPGYVMIKGLVGQPLTLKYLTRQLALKMIDDGVDREFDFMDGNATGGMIPGWQLRNDLEELTGRDIPFVYLRETRKIGGHGEQITGDRNNPLIQRGDRVLVFEELVNFAQTTTNAALILRDAGYVANLAATILSYQNPRALELLRETDVSLTHLVSLGEVVDVAEATKRFSSPVIGSFREFLADPVEWQLRRGLVIPTATAEKATEKGYKMRELSREEALVLGAPAGKLDSGFVYWTREG